MPPLARQGTLQSLRSWWSDRNPTGPTINLHATAKPLMKWMYHRAVLDLIMGSQTVPLSPETAQIYSSYVSCKYVAKRTKKLLLTELVSRARLEDEAGGLVDNIVLEGAMQLLLSRRKSLRRSASSMLMWLSGRKSTAQATCLQLVGILRKPGCLEVQNVMETLARIARRYPQAIIKTKVLDQLLHSSDEQVQKSTCTMLRGLAAQEPAAAALSCEQIVTLLLVNKPDLCASAMAVLATIAVWPYGAHSVVEANTLDHVAELLQSRDDRILKSTCIMLSRLALHEPTATALHTLEICQPIAAVLSTKTFAVYYAISVFTDIAVHADGAQTIVTTNVLDLLPKILCQERPMIWRLLKNVLSHPAIAQMTCERIVAQLGYNDQLHSLIPVIEILYELASTGRNAALIVNAHAIDHLEQLIHSPEEPVRQWASELLRLLRTYKSAAAAVERNHSSG